MLNYVVKDGWIGLSSMYWKICGYPVRIELAKEKGNTTMTIVNVVGSSIAREADKMFYTLVFPKISVQTAKAHSARMAVKYVDAHDTFFVGRGIDYELYLEGNLKLKEISYIHSEAYAVGKLKHETIILIE